MQQNQEFRVSVAPMMDWTDRHCRYFHRLLSRHTRLYTEMIVADALIHGDRDYLAGFDACEHPVALQIGGCDPKKLARAARIGAQMGYDEINLNIGCPSDRVQSGRFGACLMADPGLVADCFRAMASAAQVPVTIKCRLGIDDQDVGTALPQFIEALADAGCTHFIIHARKAWLQGLSPKENRTIPPIDYDMVSAMKARFSKLEIIVNGQLDDIDAANDLCARGGLDGFMLGRAAYHNPWILTKIDEEIYGAPAFSPTREAICEQLIAYAVAREAVGAPAKPLPRHIMGLYAGQPGARRWRQALSESRIDEPVSARIRRALSAYENARSGHAA